jgi:hypothetical protein
MRDEKTASDALRRMVYDWINGGFTEPPYPPVYYDAFERLGVDPERCSYDIRRPTTVCDGNA